MGMRKRLNSLGRRIKSYRLERELSQEKLAEKVEMSREHISCIERGKSPINIINLYRIADALDVDIKSLL